MAIIYSADQPLARCRLCGVTLQFHSDTGIVGARVRDHAFEAETIADYEPGDLTPEQLVLEIAANDSEFMLDNIEQPTPVDVSRVDTMDERARLCRIELKARVRAMMGIDFDDLEGALS